MRCNAQHADRAAVHFDRQRDERYRFLRQLRAFDGACQKARLGVDVLHDHRLAGGEHGAGDAFARGVAAARHLGFRQAVGISNQRRAGEGRSRAGAVGHVHAVGQHHPPAVQAQKFGEQVQHFAQHHLGREALADQAHHFAHQQQFLVAPGRVGAARSGGGDGRCGHQRHRAKSPPACVSPGRGGRASACGGWSPTHCVQGDCPTPVVGTYRDRSIRAQRDALRGPWAPSGMP